MAFAASSDVAGGGLSGSGYLEAATAGLHLHSRWNDDEGTGTPEHLSFRAQRESLRWFVEIPHSVRNDNSGLSRPSKSHWISDPRSPASGHGTMAFDAARASGSQSASLTLLSLG